MTIYDLALFEELNKEYRSRPLVDVGKLALRRKLLSPSDDVLDEFSQEERILAAATRQLSQIKEDIGVKDCRVLELGCGSGYLSRALLEHGGAARVTGIDIERRTTWEALAEPRLTFLAGDLSSEQLIKSGSVELVVSQVVFEHVTRPLQMLSAIRDVLTDGGTAWLRMNLYTANNASHRYREVYFPWPHLLFEDEVVRQFYERHHNAPAKTTEWINRMTVAHYLMVSLGLGFEIAAVHRRVATIDVPFYERFRDKLGRYPALDLETQFMTLVLHKRPQTEVTDIAMASVDYLERERHLEQRIATHQTRVRRENRQKRRAAAASES